MHRTININAAVTRRLPLLLVLFVVLVFGLSACGKKGPLYLENPDQQSEQQQNKN
ncbi:MAG: lipoprotein [Thioalkalispiraceae bacterium]|jgi:predicted small lipoprotein YifL